MSIVRASLQFVGRIKHMIEVTDSLGDVITDGQPIGGNYIKLKEQYPLIQQADTNDILTTGTGDVKDNRVRAIDDIANVEYDQLFVQKDDSGNIVKIIFYDREMNAYEVADIAKFLQLNEALLTSEGEPIVDSEGHILYVYKTTTEVI